MEDEDFVEVEKPVIKARAPLPHLLGVVAHAVIDDKSHSLIEDLAKRKKYTKP